MQNAKLIGYIRNVVDGKKVSDLCLGNMAANFFAWIPGVDLNVSTQTGVCKEIRDVS